MAELQARIERQAAAITGRAYDLYLSADDDGENDIEVPELEQYADAEGDEDEEDDE